MKLKIEGECVGHYRKRYLQIESLGAGHHRGQDRLKVSVINSNNNSIATLCIMKRDLVDVIGEIDKSSIKVSELNSQQLCDILDESVV